VLLNGGAVGKSTAAAAFSQHYDIPVLKIDDVITASMATNSANGLRVRELCAEAGRRLTDESTAGEERPLLSTDAVSAHSHGNYLLCSCLHCFVFIITFIANSANVEYLSTAKIV